MLRARDFEPAAGLQHSTQKRRLRRQRFLETALPCALIAALLVAAVFTVGHVGAQTRNAARLRAARSTAMLEAEGATALSSSSTTLHDQLAHGKGALTPNADDEAVAAAAAAAGQTPPHRDANGVPAARVRAAERRKGSQGTLSPS